VNPVEFLHSVEGLPQGAYVTGIMFDFTVVRVERGDLMVVELPKTYRAVPPPGWRKVVQGTHKHVEQFVFTSTGSLPNVVFSLPMAAPYATCPAAVIHKGAI
jgi:hypothetical protein